MHPDDTFALHFADGSHMDLQPQDWKPVKPMRLRILKLPAEINPKTGTAERPFAIILDRVAGITKEAAEHYAKETGARGVLVFKDEVQLGDDDAQQ